MLAKKTTESVHEIQTENTQSAAQCDMLSGDGVALFSSGLEASASDALTGDASAMFSSGLSQMFSSGLAPQKDDLRLINGDGVEMFSSGL